MHTCGMAIFLQFVQLNVGSRKISFPRKWIDWKRCWKRWTKVLQNLLWGWKLSSPQKPHYSSWMTSDYSPGTATTTTRTDGNDRGSTRKILNYYRKSVTCVKLVWCDWWIFTVLCTWLFSFVFTGRWKRATTPSLPANAETAMRRQAGHLFADRKSKINRIVYKYQICFSRFQTR